MESVPPVHLIWKTHMRSYLFAAAAVCGLVACGRPAEDSRIQVCGQATMKVVPDMVDLSLRAFNVRPAMKDAVAQTQADINQILAVCRKYIPDEEDVKVSNVATDKDYDYDNNREVFKGYSAQQILEVRLKDIRQIETFTEDLLATRINGIDNIRYDHSRADSIQRVVNLMALSDAQKTAQKMCEKMNVHLGKVTYMSNYSPAGEQQGSVSATGGDAQLNLYSKGFGGRGFKMTAEILEFRDVAFAGFEIR